jgi:uncharacterized protein (DUF1501 family)
MIRRDFLASSTLLGFGATVPGFLGRTARAAPATGRPGSKDTVLVVVQLTGGNDGLNTVIPFADPEYAKLRPTIAVPKDQVKRLNDSVGLHPSMSDLAKLYDDGAACVIQGVGYPNPNQSHFRSMDIWQAASTADDPAEGWLGKAMKQSPAPGFHLTAGGNEAAPLALAGAPARVPSVGSLADFTLKTAAAGPADGDRQRTLIKAASDPNAMPAKPAAPGLLDFVRRTAADSYASSDRLRAVAKGYEPKADYPPTGLATRLKLAAQLIEAGVGARVFYVSIDGFDTHAGQGGQFGAHAALVGEVSGAISAFYKDVAARGHGNRVCVMTFSEFGRRAKENGSGGTDHGSGAPMVLVGGRVTPGVVGPHPSLTKLEDGNLKHAIDFRRVYAAVLRDWLGVDAAAVLGAGFDPLAVFRPA